MTDQEFKNIQSMWKEIKDIDTLKHHFINSDECKISIRFHTKLPRGGNMTSGDLMLSRSLTDFVFEAMNEKAKKLRAQLKNMQVVSKLPLQELLPGVTLPPEESNPEESVNPEENEEENEKDNEEDNTESEGKDSLE